MDRIIVVVGIIGIFLTFWYARNWKGFQQDYRFDGEFQGPRYDCRVRFAHGEGAVQCLVGADRSALYLLAPPKAKRSWWRYRGKNLKIPWTDLECRAGRTVLKDCLWFEIPPKKIHFYVPKEIGDQLLRDAGRAAIDDGRRA
jgi:hypothetical protein